MSEEKANGQTEVQIGSLEGIALPLAWSEMGSAVFANQALVFMDEDALHLGFYQVVPPVSFVLSSEGRKQAVAEQLPAQAQCVSHIAWPVAKLETLIGVLTECLSKQRKRETGKKQ
jgi:hypothetical protein